MADVGTVLVETRLLMAIRASLLVVALTVQFVPALATLVHNTRAQTLAWELVAFALLATVGVVGSRSLVRGTPLTGTGRWSCAAAVVLAAVVASVALPLESLPRGENWFIGLVGWYWLFLLFDLSLPVVAAFLAAPMLLAVLGVVLAGYSAVRTADFGTSVVSIFGLQLGVAMTASVVRRIAVDAEVALRAEDEVRTREEAAAHTHRDHERRYGELVATTVPLLAALAHGALDPAADSTRRRCAVEAARMRRLFAERDTVADPLLHELGAGIDVVARRGVSVQLAVRGEARELDVVVRRELVEPIAAALACAASAARVTVLRRADGVRLSVVTDRVCELPPRASPRHTLVSAARREGKLWLETVWPRR
ncbi:hypothetical protein NLX83_29420 [Allokutzneria sp. A3M-2-11 16]|uniref:hypothetical protein n=1 Tax=Allokutzneria sp. A3M-2-11 16 TaxID=2962043 RepID=UPI0020B68712|nr:hypothetical protein [Allokutzneria sp. A3M-2-11 16]MCP3803402.1 hypothetical protein [Allokutzneria sp. A3M-2-11 16]